MNITNPIKSKILDFPVVGIGASAGGLEALQEFFKSMPSSPGAAFVVVQHLSPDYKSLMDELLARCTTMKIHKVVDGMSVEENHIYLIPPRMNMTIFHGKLYLKEIISSKILNLPIDVFLRSLAEDQEKNAIGIILSGTGSDGTLGIRAIKEFGGMTMVQDDRSAKFDGMPRSSISTGMVDFILPPAKLAEELVNYIKHPFIKQKEHVATMLNADENQIAKVIAILKDAKGVDFSDYKENTIIRRLEKRININRFEDIDGYVRFLSNNTREINILFNELLIGVTRFFRDEESYKVLKTEVVQQLIKKATPRQEIRVWVPGCSTGEEAYSLAILFRECMIEMNRFFDVKIFATDVDTVSLEFAGAGVYPESIASDVMPERITKFFIKKEHGYQINDNIRSMIIFARHNILQDPPFSKIDLISCRNLLIYLNNEVQQRILSMFYSSLNEFGYLFLGSSESLGPLAEGFITIDSKAKIFKYQKGFKAPHLQTYGVTNIYKSRSDLKSFGTFIKNSRSRIPALEGVLDEILSEYIPPSVIINENYEVVHTIHSVGKFVSLPVGNISLNLLKMLPKEMSIIVNSLIRRTDTKNTEVVFENINHIDPEKQLSVACKKISDKKTGEIFYLVSFIEKDKKEKNIEISKVESLDVNIQYQERIEELEKELQFKSESLQATVEELETSNEELQSSNEELIASNEELQSTNEELQSVNEELYTVNSEHIKKIEELTELYTDIDNLLKNTQIGNLFLSRDLTIRKINEIASKLTNVLSSDVGRPIQHLSVNNIYPDFITDIYKVLNTLIPIEKEIHDAEGKCYLMSILPYRTAENAVNGILITFVNITSLKQSEKNASELSNRLQMALSMGGMSWWEWDFQNNIVNTGKGKYEMLGYTIDEIGVGYEAWTNLVHPEDIEQVMNAMMKHLEAKADFYYAEYRIKHKLGHYIWYRDKGGIVSWTNDGKPDKIIGVVMNITHEKESEEKHKKEITGLEEKYQEVEVHYDILFKTIQQGIVFQSADGKIIDANPRAEELLGRTLSQMKGLTSSDTEWRAIREDGTPFEGKDHPAMVALSTGKPVNDVLMGVYHPNKNDYIWLKINAIPLFKPNENQAYQVYAIFDEVKK